jgi:putative ribosome biogenesis GTPase RsgA
VEHRNAYQLYTEAGEFSAELAGRLRYHTGRDEPTTHPVVGDWVVVRPRPGEAKAVIQGILPRRTQFVRGAAGSEGSPQVVAANVDIVLTLINRLLGSDGQRVGDLRSIGNGRHTTTTRSLLTRPGGGLVFNTPGMRELQLWEGGDGHDAAFADVEISRAAAASAIACTSMSPAAR